MKLTRIGTENESAFAPLLFGQKASAFSLAVGVLEDETAAGVALFSRLGTALMLDYLYVAVPFRRKGIAKAIIQKVQRSTESPIHVNYPERDEALHGFFFSLGFRLYRDGRAYNASVSSFLESKAFQKLIKAPQENRVLRINTLTNKEMDILRRYCEQEDLDPKTMDDPMLSRGLSMATMNSVTGKPTAIVLCEVREKQITILFLVNFSHDARQLVDIFRAFLDAVKREELQDADLSYVSMDERTELLAKKLTDNVDLIRSEGKVISAILLPEEWEKTEEDASWKEEQLLPEKTEEYADPDPGEVFLVRTISKSQRTKRGLRFNEKAIRQAKARKELFAYLAAWKGAPGSHEELLAFLHPAKDHETTPEELKRDEAMYRQYEKEFPEIDLSRFAYQNDEEFLGTDFSARFAALRYFANAGDLSSEMREQVRETLIDYEMHALILQSPYYALLGGRDFDEMPDSELELRIKQTEHDAVKGFLREILDRRKKQKG